MRLALQVGFVALDIILRMLKSPGMIQSRVIGHEVEQQLHSALTQPIANSGQRRITTEIDVHMVGLNREG